jgi:hypothetical protein
MAWRGSASAPDIEIVRAVEIIIHPEKEKKGGGD